MDFKDKRVTGLYLRVSHTGRMVWTLLMRLGDTLKRYELGVFSDSDGGLSLTQARDKAEEWKRRIRAGDDPLAMEKARRKDTFEVVRSKFFEQHVRRNLKPNTQAAYKSSLEHKRFRDWEGRMVQSITRAEVIALIDEIANQGTLIQANRTLAYLRKFFNWCAEKDIIRGDEPIPTDRVKPPLRKEAPRDRVLEEWEIKAFWKATEGLGYPYKQVYRLFLATGQRRSECAGIRRTDFDLDESQWLQRDNKAGRDHIVPLNELAQEVIKDCPDMGEFLFTTQGDRPINGFTKSKARLDALMGVEAERLEKSFVPWQIHDLRRTMTTYLRKAGVSRDVCSVLLNHVSRGVTAAHYDRYDMLEEKGLAMKVWGSILERILWGQPENVVSLRENGND